VAAHVRGMAAQMLAAIGVRRVPQPWPSTTARGTMAASSTAGWSTPPAEVTGRDAGIDARAVPLMMTDEEATAAMVREAYAVAASRAAR
jgi:LPPG:FO 2-phospho-L-lactate transferase